MGVRGIFTLLRKNLSSYSTRKEYDASLQAQREPVECSEEEAPDKRGDLIVVDGNAFVYWFVTFTLGRESSCQTDYVILSSKLHEWLLQCHRHRIHFIFIFDGPTDPSKWPTKIKRMRNQSQDIYSSQMHKLYPSESVPPSVASVPPVLGLQAVLLELEKHQSDNQSGCGRGCGMVRVIHAEGEADKDIARVAVQQRAMAVLSNDSDMMFFHTARRGQGDTPVPVPLLPFASFQFSMEGNRLALEALIQRSSLAKAAGMRSEVSVLSCAGEEVHVV